MHLRQLLDFVEHAPDHRGRWIAGQLLHFPVGQQVDVELGADPLDEPRQRHADITRREARRIQLVMDGQKVAQQRDVVLRGHRDAVINDHGFDLAVHDDAHHRVLEAPDEHRFIDHRVLGTAQASQFVGDTRKVASWRRRDEQGFEVWPAHVSAAGNERHTVRHAAGVVVGALPFAGVIAIAAREQRAA